MDSRNASEAAPPARDRGGLEESILIAQGNLANTYAALGYLEHALRMRREVYTRTIELLGERHGFSINEALNYANDLLDLRRFEESRSLLRKTVPIARRVLGESNATTLRFRWTCAKAFYQDDGATLDDLHEALTTLEDVTRIGRRVLGGAHPAVVDIEISLRNSRRALRARESLLAKYLLYGASALAVAAFLVQRSRRR